jgi:hypothetical protein
MKREGFRDSLHICGIRRVRIGGWTGNIWMDERSSKRIHIWLVTCMRLGDPSKRKRRRQERPVSMASSMYACVYPFGVFIYFLGWPESKGLECTA